MNRLRYITLSLLISFVGCISYAGELTAAQHKFRTSLEEFLKEEGFVPTIDEEDNSVNFKKEGTLFWITVGGTSPIYLEFHRAGLNCEDADKALVLQAVNTANKKVRCAKAMFNEQSVSFAIEMYCHSSEEFRYIFYKSLKELENISDEVVEFYNSNGDSPSVAPSSQTAAAIIDKFFPVYGCTLGRVTVSDMETKGYEVETVTSGAHNCTVRGLTFWDHDKDNVFERIYVTHSHNLPEPWKDKLGINWNLSYNQFISKFKSLGFDVKVVKAPFTKEYSGRKTLSAEILATSGDGHLTFELDFDYGNSKGEGYSTSSPNTLYSIRIEVK